MKPNKTLKDLDKKFNDWHDRTTVDYVIDDIRNAGKEKLRELRTIYSSEEGFISDESYSYIEGQIDFIIHFFNLE